MGYNLKKDFRQCRYEGKLKVKYKTQEEAEKRLVILKNNNFLPDGQYEVYKCQLCDKYHIGHPKRKKKKKKPPANCQKCNIELAEFIISTIEDDTLFTEEFGIIGKEIIACAMCVKEIQREVDGVTIVRKRGR